MKKVVYVTGCLGFIGHHLTRILLNQGFYVIGVDKMTYASNENFLGNLQRLGQERFKFIKSDINDLDKLYDCDYVINTAAETHVDNSIVSSEVFLKSNINGVHRLLELIKEKNLFKIPTLLHFSTDEVYGDIEKGNHYETDLLKPSNPYSASKAAADMLILAWARTFNVPYIIVRPTNNYGTGQYAEKLIPKTCKHLLLDRKVDVHDKGLPKRTWLHVEDTCRAILQIISSKCKDQIFNINGNHECSNIDVIRKIINWTTGDKDIEKYLAHFTRPGGDVRYSLDDSKLRNLGWEPRADFDSELKKIIDYHKENFIW